VVQCQDSELDHARHLRSTERVCITRALAYPEAPTQLSARNTHSLWRGCKLGGGHHGAMTHTLAANANSAALPITSVILTIGICSLLVHRPKP
jgi:hypothetical protein